MQLRILSSLAIFIGSYLPLSLILLAQDFKYYHLSKPICWDFFTNPQNCIFPFNNPKLSISIFVMCLICFFATLFVLNKTKTKRKIKIHSANHVPTELMSYTLPYVVSFMGVGYNEEGKFIGIIIFLMWMFWITHKTGQIILNPILIVFNWRLYNIKYSHIADTNEYSCYALTKGEVFNGDEVNFASIQDVFVIR